MAGKMMRKPTYGKKPMPVKPGRRKPGGPGVGKPGRRKPKPLPFKPDGPDRRRPLSK